MLLSLWNKYRYGVEPHPRLIPPCSVILGADRLHCGKDSLVTGREAAHRALGAARLGVTVSGCRS